MEITVLCKVVDNFGDIGVCWRMAKRLKQLCSINEINLVVDDLPSFKRLNDSVNETDSYQVIEGVNIYNSKNYEFCYSEFSGEKSKRLQVILECFQCGRPDWLEKILFDDELNHIVQIIMIDYLSAEKYAEDFHKLQSLTRRAKVQKVNFMPGFTEKTGGLIIDEGWEKLSDRNEKGPVLFFCYDRDWSSVAKAAAEGLDGTDILVAQGKGHDSLVSAFDEYKLEYKSLSFMNQTEWDQLMRSCSFLFIRGEESLSRACLSGIPFVWHAYPQSDEYQLVKVKALLERMKKHFSADEFTIIEKVWLYFNSPEDEVDALAFEKSVQEMLEKQKFLVRGFRDFALDLRKIGDQCVNLMTFIEEKCIMNK